MLADRAAWGVDFGLTCMAAALVCVHVQEIGVQVEEPFGILALEVRSACKRTMVSCFGQKPSIYMHNNATTP
jgi:hypothetical protein